MHLPLPTRAVKKKKKNTTMAHLLISQLWAEGLMHFEGINQAHYSQQRFLEQLFERHGGNKSK